MNHLNKRSHSTTPSLKASQQQACEHRPEHQLGISSCRLQGHRTISPYLPRRHVLESPTSTNPPRHAMPGDIPVRAVDLPTSCPVTQQGFTASISSHGYDITSASSCHLIVPLCTCNELNELVEWATINGTSIDSRMLHPFSTQVVANLTQAPLQLQESHRHHQHGSGRMICLLCREG